jgi:hypothetical protein
MRTRPDNRRPTGQSPPASSSEAAVAGGPDPRTAQALLVRGLCQGGCAAWPELAGGPQGRRTAGSEEARRVFPAGPRRRDRKDLRAL